MTCVYKEHEIKTKKVQEQWLQLKMKFSLGYKTWKLLFSGEDGEINLWWVGRREDKNLVVVVVVVVVVVGRGVLLEGFSQVGGMSQFSAGGRGLPPSFPVGKPIYICTSVPGCVLITLANLNPAFFFLSPEVLKNLISCPRQTKSPDNSNLLLMFNNNIMISEQPAKTS